MSYWNFLSSYRTLLAFGLVTALSSSFGQTFFISLFLPFFLEDFGISKGDFGLLYGLCTLTSAAFLPYLGGRIDALDLRKYTSWTLAGMATAAFVVSFSPHVLLLAAGIVGLRLTGQGLMGHISQTVMSREFTASRGKALGFAALGYPLGEAVLPLLCAVALQWLPWKAVWFAVGLGAIVVILPLALGLLSRPPARTEAAIEEAKTGSAVQADEGRAFLRDPRLYLALPVLMTPPALMTVLFLYQAPLAEFKGWAPEWMAAAFAAFAATRALTALAVGPLIDRFSAAALLPVITLPITAAALLLLFAPTPWLVFPYLMLVGLTAGSNSSTGSALWAELFGTRNLGKVRGVSQALAIFAAASGPAAVGLAFRAGYGFDQVLAAAATIPVLTSCLGLTLAIREGAFPRGRRLARAFR